MFSDMLQDGMRTKMMSDLRPAHDEAEAEDLKGTVSYKPEFSWTYEAGTKLRVLESRLTLDAALFLTSVRDQQIARFSDNGYGRMMVNAGRSRSWGAELSLKYAPVEAISAWASYGFTHATFTKYDDGTDQNYTHNYVPFIPRHTLSAGIDWKAVSSSMGSGQQSTVKFHSLTLGINTLGAGRIYWNEANDLYQPFYALLGASVTLAGKHYSLQLWGRNLTGTAYHTFHFVSIGHAFLQRGHGRSLGMTLRVNIQ
jgi:outer membrane receptor protein involved in Fe transport